MAAKRDSLVPLGEVQQTPGNGGASAVKSAPAEHVASPVSPPQSGGSSTRTSFQSHSRAMSAAAAEVAGPARPSRLSVSFHVSPAGAGSPTKAAQPPAPDSPPVGSEVPTASSGPTDTDLLTAIAAQERRALELKEELQRAEADLRKLKRQWTQHEANKKRNDARRLAKLQPLQTTILPHLGAEEDTDGSSAWMQQEMERRKALMNSGKSSNRTVFPGSRHTRTLSLLSPARDDAPRASAPTSAAAAATAAAQRPLPPRKDSLPSNAKRSLDSQHPASRPNFVSRSSTVPDPLTAELVDKLGPDMNIPDNLDVAGIDREALIRTGKKMASEFTGGLWTFIEDIRQAAVGNEATQHTTVNPPLRRAQSTQQPSARTIRTVRSHGSKSTLRPSSRGSNISGNSNETRRPSRSPQSAKKHTKTATQGALPDLADPSFWTEHDLSSVAPQAATPLQKSPTVRGHKRDTSKAVSVKSDDPWDTWDDPSPKDSRSNSAASESNTAATSVSVPPSPKPGADKKDPLPWPALGKIGPASLRRTAGHLMSEWERSLGPSAGKGAGADYLGLGAEAAATDVGKKQD